MRIIDKTPLQDENGNINLISRVRGTLKFGLNWYPELEAQKKVIPQLDRWLEKGFVLLRNFTLPYSDIVIPMILIGPGTVSVILASPVKGQFEAKGAEWSVINSDGSTMPARRNLIDLIIKLSRAFQKYLERRNIHLPVQVEAVLICSDPGAQVETLRPLVRVVRSDAVKQFASTLLQARPAMRNDTIYALAERIINPEAEPDESLDLSPPDDEFDPNKFGAFRDSSTDVDTIPPHLQEPNPARRRPAQIPPKKRTFGMTQTQLFLLVGMLIVECCVLIGAVAVYLLFLT